LMQGSPSTSTEEISISYVAASTIDTIVTSVGTFSSLKITATESDGDSVVYWWSPEVGNFVKQQEFSSGSSQPSVSMILTDFNRAASTSSVTLFIGIGAGVAIFAVIVLIVVLIMRRRPGQPIPYQPGMPEPQPYAPPPQGPPSPGTETVLRSPEDLARRAR
jgi:hypothetical protein